MLLVEFGQSLAALNYLLMDKLLTLVQGEGCKGCAMSYVALSVELWAKFRSIKLFVDG